MMPSLENPFTPKPKKPRIDDALGAVRKLMGPEAAAELERAGVFGPPPSPAEQEPTDIVTPEELAATAARERDRIREQHPPITATVLQDPDSASFEAGREITLNLQEVLAFSTSFLQDKAPPAWAAELRETFPHGIALTPEQRSTIERAIQHGFTNPEWLLTQRREVEERAPLTAAQRTTQFGDPRIHAFDGYDNSPTKSRWAWNLDSRVPGCWASGRWNPRSRQSILFRYDSARSSSSLGARPAVVVEI